MYKTTPSDEVVLEVRNLKTYFQIRGRVARAVDDVSFSVRAGQTLGIVGESGSGKSVTCASIMGVLPRNARVIGGEVILDGESVLHSPARMRQLRGSKIATILQDPMSSLNPVFTTGDQVAAPVRAHLQLSRSSVAKYVIELFRRVRIPSPETRVRDYPHQMSGGMRQRVCGAMAISCGPKVLLADEPTTSLDVTVQAQFLSLLKRIQAETGMAIVIVTHDFGVVAKMCHNVAVMYGGKIVEYGSVRDIFTQPSHPYTRALLNSVPRLDREAGPLASIDGQPPDLLALPPGCSFNPRCPIAQDVCREQEPPNLQISADHRARCFFPQNGTA